VQSNGKELTATKITVRSVHTHLVLHQLIAEHDQL